MNHPPLRLSFAARSLDEHTHIETMQYDTLALEYQASGIYIKCILPNDAISGDSISLSATSVTGRDASFSAEVTLTKNAVDTGYVEVCLTGYGSSGEYVLQLNLLGIYNTIKNTAEFNAQIHNPLNIKTPVQTPFFGRVWAKTAKRHAASVLTSLLSVF
ncbi:hypothetical protein PCIT_b0123 [Pseudoalteromonas citrea]|uniref:Uncharacterized protein n=2 Tax=Pseudoalteromonas citrea TaxID=43655 RepID=A0AAD4ADZ1_9GAMM|nr:hypothetical protein [Pseudoalteromonas citrea]KAF7764196.1 hypothetical protein PCIT_b0123 [Pseudoalteromonas citrea]